MRLRPAKPRILALPALALAALAMALPTGAAAESYTPPHHHIFHGVSDTGDNADFRAFTRDVGAHPAVLQDFYHWDTPLTTGALDRWDTTDTRGVLSLSTQPGGASEIISPGKIANARGDHYMLRLNDSIANSKQVVYIRLFPEMNGYWNAYSAFNSDGTQRGPKHTTGKFIKAWRRFSIIVHGGKRWKINRQLKNLGMPRILHASSNHDPKYARRGVPRILPKPKVALMWVPQTVSSPNVAGNSPKAYWPGKDYVDWVGADIYSKYSSMMPHLTSFYHQWDKWPFVIGEYSPWDNDYTGSFTRKLFNWAEDHGRTRMLIYYRSVYADSPFDITHFPVARKILTHTLNHSLYDPYAPGTRNR